MIRGIYFVPLAEFSVFIELSTEALILPHTICTSHAAVLCDEGIKRSNIHIKTWRDEKEVMKLYSLASLLQFAVSVAALCFLISSFVPAISVGGFLKSNLLGSSLKL